MACGAITSATQRSLKATAGLVAYEWFTPWIPCTGLDKFVAVLSNTAVTGSFRSKVAAQWAAVRTDAPDAPMTYGSAKSGAGAICVDSGDVSASSASKFFVRFGVEYDLSTGVNPAAADVELQVSYDMCGQVVGATSEQLVATSTTALFRAITPWVPALHAKEMKAAVVVNSLEGNFQWKMTYRTAATMKELASTWESDWDPGGQGTSNPYRTAVEINTTELGPTVTDKMWVQFGIQYNLSSGSTPGQASVSIAVAVRK